MNTPKHERSLIRRRILICGGRNWINKQLIHDVLLKHLNPKADYIIHGDTRGADRLGAEVAAELGVSANRVLSFPADWVKYHKAAGPIRNQQILTEGKPDIVLAFHDNIVASKGTADMVRRALKAGLLVFLNGVKLL